MKTLRMMFASVCLMCVSLADAQMLKCQFKDYKGNADNVAVYYSPDGSILASAPVRMNWNEDGSFGCDLPDGAKYTDVTIYAGDNDTFGAHLVPGKTVTMTISKDKDGNLKADFEGEAKAISYAVSKMADTYSISRYFPMGGSIPPYAENSAKLDKSYAESKALIKAIKDKKERAAYAEYNDYCYKFMAIRLKLEEINNNGEGRLSEDLLYKELTKGVDINSALAYRSYLSMLMFDAYHTIKMPFGTDMGDYCRESMQICDKYITNPELRKHIIQEVGTHYFSYGDDSGDYRKFYKDACEWAGADSIYFKQYEKVMESWEKTKAGSKAYDITLTDAEGKTVQLLDLVKGKFAYIDIWATWCGPCKKEIPNFAKLAEKYDGKNDIMFISISVDENVDAWKKMIGEEKPSWAQYNVSGETNKEFSAQWGITGIPRFLMIDKNGNIYSADAPRPSSEKAEEVLESMSK